MRLARVLGAIGRTLITAGSLILLFVAYQLWGTGIHEARAQNSLENQFEEQLAAAGITTTTADPEADDPIIDGPEVRSTPSGEPPPVPPEGEALGVIEIPRIGVDKWIVEGVRLKDLKKGPGHYPDSPMPGTPGNAAIAGHRTTYGAPFHRIDELDPGDEILVTTLQGTFRYEVMPIETGEIGDDGEPIIRGHQIVRPSQTEVLDDFGDNRLTLTACHPKYSARQRIVVVAELKAEPVEPPSTTVPDGRELAAGEDLQLDLDGEGASAAPAIWWGLGAAFIWLVAWLAARRWRRWPSYLIGAPSFFIVLFVFFENFSRLLPANY